MDTSLSMLFLRDGTVYFLCVRFDRGIPVRHSRIYFKRATCSSDIRSSLGRRRLPITFRICVRIIVPLPNPTS